MISKRIFIKYAIYMSFLPILGNNFIDKKGYKFYLQKILNNINRSYFPNSSHLNYRYTSLDLDNMKNAINISINNLHKNSIKIDSNSLLKDITKRDFKNNNLIEVDGWVLSKNEFILMVLKKVNYHVS